MFIIKHTQKFIIAAAVIFVLAIGITLSLGLNLGIDFTGGALTEVTYTERPAKAVFEERIAELDLELPLGNISLRETMADDGRPGYILRTRDLSESERQEIESVMTSAGAGATLGRYTSVGPVIGEELKRKALWAIVGVSIVIIFYVAFAFRSVSKPIGGWIFGNITILALLHDVLVPTAFMSILGYTVGAEIDVLFVMAILAVLGYSVNDTIVVFDRVRENILKYRQEKKVKKEGKETTEYIFTKPFENIVGESVGQTLTRSINTSITTALALLALYFVGGEVTQTFALVLLVGVISGTYSSLCIANPVLIYFGNRKIAKDNKAKQ